jgi:hypothetical protein
MADSIPDAGNSRARPPAAGGIGLYSAIAIGIGGMVGAGIFSILGVVAQAAGNGMWISSWWAGSWPCSALTPTPNSGSASHRPVFRSLRGGHDGQRCLPADLLRRQCGASEDHRRHPRQKMARLALADRLHDHAGGPELLYLPKFQAGSHHHDRLAALLLCPGMGLSNQDRKDHQAENLIRRLTRGVLACSELIRKPQVTLRLIV